MVVSPISCCCVTYAHYFTQKKGELQACSDTFLRETRNSVLHSASICRDLHDYCRFIYAHLYSLVILWFVGNLGLYVFLKYLFSPNVERAIDYLPEKLVIKEADIEAEQLSLMGFKIKFPFYKEDISSITPFFFDHQLHDISIKLSNVEEIPFIIFTAIPDELDDSEASLISKIWSKIVFKEESLSELIKSSHHARLKDYSWWNLLHNIKLSSYLILKAMSLSSYDKFNVYEIETPYLNGLLIQGYLAINGKTSKRTTIDFSFRWEDIRYSVSFIGVDSNNLLKARNILSTIQPISDVEASYNMMKNMYDNREVAPYPEELLLASILSIKNLSINELEQLLKIMKIKNNQDYIIDPIKEEIKYLRDNQAFNSNASQQ